MKEDDFNWNKDKNELIKNSERKISFEIIVSAILDDQVLEIIDNPSSNHANQQCYVLEINDYIYLVPFVKNDNEIFLKTIFPSRKHKKFYLTKRRDNED